jgi:hypothetical protein
MATTISTISVLESIPKSVINHDNIMLYFSYYF